MKIVSNDFSWPSNTHFMWPCVPGFSVRKKEKSKKVSKKYGNVHRETCLLLFHSPYLMILWCDPYVRIVYVVWLAWSIQCLPCCGTCNVSWLSFGWSMNLNKKTMKICNLKCWRSWFVINYRTCSFLFEAKCSIHYVLCWRKPNACEYYDENLLDINSIGFRVVRH